MRKGLTTLMTVAIALVSVQSMAMAPLIQDLPSVVVGNKDTGTMTVKYTYIDAFNLNTIVTDDNTSAPMLKWSYEIGGTAKYAVNGDQTLNSAVDDPVAPAAAKQINLTQNSLPSAASPAGEDGLANTVTIRNINLYPYGGTPSTDQSVAAQAWNAHVQAVTFWCSDGNLASSSTVLFWTDNHYDLNQPIGWNRLSGQSVWSNVKTDTSPGLAPWVKFDYDSSSGKFWDHTTSHTLNGVGVCFNVTATGNNMGSVQSPMPYFTLQANMVYRIRATMNSSQASAGHTPFWDFILENWNGDGTKGLNLYGMDSYFLDNEGGANTVLQTTGGTDTVLYWTPLPLLTAQWNNATTGIFAPTYAAVKNPCLRFRVMDVDSNAALGNNTKFGDICLTKCVVDSTPYSKCVLDTNVVNITTPQAASNTVPGGNMIVSQLTGSTAQYASGYLTITAPAAAQGAEMVEIAPATDTNYTFPSNNILDNWPIQWQSNKIYRMQVDLLAPDANSAAHPYDVTWLSIEPPTNELITESFVTANKAIGTPKQVPAVQTYTMFYNSGLETKSTVANLHHLRWRIRFANSTALNWPNPADTLNAAIVRVDNIKVDIVKFQ